MDHRCSVRTDTRLPVLLRVSGQWIPAVMRNMSEGGLYVETPRVLRTHAYVAVVVKPTRRGEERLHELPALVVHRDAAGAGLMLAGNEAVEWWRYHPRARVGAAESLHPRGFPWTAGFAVCIDL
ncbi:MAG: PilZ domain-containing protein [Proteobacteria bacterium]|nr:MAG: PilZ domain-containing protein [Pseudomonadota bacterium]QKK10415.1 MAG: PilZ domain-containing protein [Pseudomonadota bacterium]